MIDSTIHASEKRLAISRFGWISSAEDLTTTSELPQMIPTKSSAAREPSQIQLFRFVSTLSPLLYADAACARGAGKITVPDWPRTASSARSSDAITAFFPHCANSTAA